MRYTKPLNATDPDSSYWDANPATGKEGAIVPAAAIEPSMREIVNAIAAAGLTPRADNLTQLARVISMGIPPYKADTPYQTNDFAQLNGTIYCSLSGSAANPNIGKQPNISPSDWKELSFSNSDNAANATKWSGKSQWVGAEASLPASKDANTIYYAY